MNRTPRNFFFFLPFFINLKSGKAMGNPIEDLGPTPKLKHINHWDMPDRTSKCLVP